jgi:hypothetical protein
VSRSTGNGKEETPPAALTAAFKGRHVNNGLRNNLGAVHRTG